MEDYDGIVIVKFKGIVYSNINCFFDGFFCYNVYFFRYGWV